MPIGAQVVRYGECVENFFEFCTHSMVQDETHQQVIPLKIYDHQKLIVLCIMYYKYLALIKAKQIGASVIFGNYHLWLCHRPSTKVLCLSAGQREASALLDKSRFVNENMPEWLKLKTGSDGNELITFPVTRSQILALPSTPKAGVGETATHVTRDELDFHDYADENFSNIKPTIDRGASDAAMSTSDRTKPASHLKVLYRKGKGGENRYHPLFLPWYVHPERNMKWYKQTRKDYSIPWMFEGAYPNTEDEALGSVEGEGLFDRVKLTNLMRNSVPPIEERGAGVYIFHKADPRIRYYAGGDCAEGKGGDFQCLWIEGEYKMQRFLAAIIHTNKATPDIFANLSIQLLHEYHRPMLVCGNDPYGEMYLKYLDMLGYGMYIYNSDIKKIGYNEQELKQQFHVNLLKFSKSVGDGLIVEYQPALQEMLAYNLEGGKFVCSAPHDDTVCAGKLATVARELSPSSEEVEVDSYY